jgi:tetratricopeptide (TPR) repeat protein
MDEQVLIHQLFTRTGHREKVAWLEQLQPLGSTLENLLGWVVSCGGDQPEAARESLLALAHVADASELVPLGAQARYLAAQNFAANGQLNIALNLIEAARAAFANVGDSGAVLRTHIGRITVLAELGRYQEALAVADEVVEAVSGMVHPSTEFHQLRCLAQLNRGSCYWHMGAHDAALAAFASAEAGFKELGALERLPAVANNRGLVLMEMGRIREAMEAFLFTAEAAKSAQTPVPRAQALANAARASSLLGEFENGLARFAESRSILSGQAATEEAIILRETADLYLSLNLYDEAREAYEASVEHLRESGARRHLGWSLWGLGAYGIATGNFVIAERNLGEAVEVFTETDNSMSLSGVLLERSSLHLLAGNRDAAYADASHALALVSRSELVAPKAFAHLRIAEALWNDPSRAERHLVEAELLSESIGLPQLLFRCKLRSGQLRRQQKRLLEARQSFEDAVRQVERLRGRIAQEAVRASFMGDKSEAYGEWVSLLMELDDPVAAFNAAEHAKSRTLVDVLSGSSGICRMELPADENGLHLHRELMAVYNRLLSTDPAQQATGSLEELRKRARNLEAQLQRSNIQPAGVTGHESARAWDLSNHSLPSSWRDIAKSLPVTTTLVEYFCAGGEVVAFVANGASDPMQYRLGPVDRVRALSDRLFVQIQRCELQRDMAKAYQKGLLASCRRVLRELHAILIEPLQSISRPLRTQQPVELVIIPHGPLHRLPFHALYGATQRYLLEDYEISYAPSASVMALCEGQRREPIKKALIVGTQTNVLPSIGKELEALQELFPGALVLRDASATVAEVRKSSSGQDLLHLACHGVFRTDNPLYSALQLDDGWFTAADLLSLNLEGALVTLSACESGRSSVTGGDELIGFSRAALAAGAASVVVSGWRVDDGTTACLMEDFYAGLLSGMRRASALRAAQLAVMERHPHPWHWAPFTLSGQR